ncbi:MAG: hypothetical protein ABNH00_06725 [Dokdonia sp.]|jgi:hypothetical protein
MKKTIKAELISLAHKILQLKDGADYSDLANKAQLLHQKLIVLAYAEKLEKQGLPTIGLEKVEGDLLSSENKTTSQPIAASEPANVEAEKKSPAEILAENQAKYAEARSNDKYRPDGTQFNDEEPLHEPVIEKIKDMVAEMPPEAAQIDELIDSIEPKSYQKNDMFDIGGEYAQMPIFDPVDTAIEEETPKNLNDKLKSGLKIGLNDRLSFIKHLFNGSTEDYNRVLSQLSTFQTSDEAKKFVQTMVKPDYNQWEGKEAQEEKFISIIDAKFGA